MVLDAASNIVANRRQNFPSLVTMYTRTVWSRQLRQHKPSRSGLQSKLTMGCEEITLELRSSTVPATPTGTLSCQYFSDVFFSERAEDQGAGTTAKSPSRLNTLTQEIYRPWPINCFDNKVVHYLGFFFSFFLRPYPSMFSSCIASSVQR